MKQDVQFTPWRSIRAGVVTPSVESRSYANSLASPCLSCSTSPCCTHLPIHTFQVSSLGDLNYAGYLLNFAHIRLAISRSGDWSVYYVTPCRFLDRIAFTCTLHGTDAQPNICANYNPYGCWYRRAFTSADGEELVLVDRARLDRLAEILLFDEHQRLVSAPNFDTVRAELSRIADEADPDEADPPIADPAFDGWLDELQGRGGPLPDADVETFSAAGVPGKSPCSGCSAPCCETLAFPQGVPTGASGFDWFRFCLGFPGIELSITQEQWSVVVKTRCRHLLDGRCSVYGQPSRPLFCRYYDEWKCSYRVEFGRTRPPASFRVRLEQFDALLECFDLDESGALVAMSPHDAMRAHVEASIRASSTVGVTLGRSRPSATDLDMAEQNHEQNHG